MKNPRILAILLLGAVNGWVASSALAQSPLPDSTPRAPGKVEKTAQGVALTTASGVTTVEIWTERVVRVTHSPARPVPPTPSLAVIAQPAEVKWQFTETEREMGGVPRFQNRQRVRRAGVTPTRRNTPAQFTRDSARRARPSGCSA